MSFDVTDNEPRIQYTAAASQTVFTVPFEFLDDSDLLVYQTLSGATPDDTLDILTLTTDYTASGAGVTGGGSITLTTGAASGDTITIVRDIGFERLTDYQDNGDFLADTVNTDFDRIMLMIQQLEEAINQRMLRFQNTEQVDSIDASLPKPEAAKLLGWNGSATGLSNYSEMTPGTLLTTTYTESLLTASDAATARATLGLNESVSVAEFGASGSGDETTEIQAAVTYAIANSIDLYWPNNTYTVSSAITNYHTVTHIGPGAMKNGTDTWYVEGKASTARKIYVHSGTGSDSNDGIASGTALASEAKALKILHEMRPKSGETAVVEMNTGHTIKETIQVETGASLRWVTIESIDATVTVDSSFTGANHIMAGTNCNMPVLNVLIDANGEGDYGYNLQEHGYGEILTGKGIKNTGGRGLYINDGSTVVATGAVFTGAGSLTSNAQGRGAWVTRGSTLLAETADFSDAYGTGIYISRASTVHAMDVTIDDCGGHGVWCHRSSRFTAHATAGVSIDNSTLSAINVTRSSIVSVNGANILTCKSVGITCTSSVVNAESATITSQAGSTNGVECSQGGTVNLSGATVTGFDANNVDCNGGTVDAVTASITGAGVYGVFVSRGRLNLALATVTGSGTTDIHNVNGSFTSADGCTTTAGAPAIADCNLAAFDTLYGDGAVFN